MDGTLLAEKLAKTCRQIEGCQRMISQMEATIAKLEAGGHPTRVARDLLSAMRASRRGYERDRDRYLPMLENSRAYRR